MILRRAISKYHQGIIENEIEGEIAEMMKEMGVNNLEKTQVNIEGSDQTSGVESSSNNSHSLLLNSFETIQLN